jgi:hypothetical protein
MARSALFLRPEPRNAAKAESTMIIPPWLKSLFVGLLICNTAPTLAQQFSADLVMTGADAAGAAPAGTIRVLNGKIRIETPQFAGGFFLIDGTEHTAFFVRPTQKIFMDARQSSWLTQLFISVDPSNPCRQWQDSAKLAGVADQSEWQCQRTGEEKVHDRSTIAYRATSSSRRYVLGWVDPELKVPLKIQMENGTTITADNVREEPQSPRLFEIPSGFRKFNPQALINLVKQSDAWVDEPAQ